MHNDLKIKDTRRFHHDNPDIVLYLNATYSVTDSLYKVTEGEFYPIKYEQIPALEYIYTIARRSQIRIPPPAQSLKINTSEHKHDYQIDNKKIIQEWIGGYNKICDEINETKNGAKQGLDGDTE